MATTATNPRVQQLCADARAKTEETASLLDGLTAEQGSIVTEIGWTVAATAAHLASGAGFATTQLKQLKQDKAPTVPSWVVDTINLFTSRKNKKASLSDSVQKIRDRAIANLALLEDWTDAELDTGYKKPYFGAKTYEEGLRNTLVGHYDEHMGQVRRALSP